MKILSSKSGIILTETLVAIGMIMVATLIMAGLVTSAATTTKLSKGYLVAQNLATEGIEIIKNIRSTNKLIESDDRTCWLRVDPSQACNTPGIKAEIGKDYILDTLNGKWFLSEAIGEPLDLKNTSTDDFYQIFTGAPLAYTSQGSGVDPTPYYRSIKFTELDPADDFATVEVLVQWKDGSKVREVRQFATLYNI